MQKTQKFEQMHLVRDGMRELDAFLTSEEICDVPARGHFSLDSEDGGKWQFATVQEFLLEYEPFLPTVYERYGPHVRVTIVNSVNDGFLVTTVTVAAPDKVTIQKIFDIVEKYRAASTFGPVER